WSPGGCHGTARTPSKRSKPNSVPSQIYPSGVCAMAQTAPLKKPSRTVQAVCAYWLMSSDELTAEAILQHTRSALSAVPAPLAMRTIISSDRLSNYRPKHSASAQALQADAIKKMISKNLYPRLQVLEARTLPLTKDANHVISFVDGDGTVTGQVVFGANGKS